MDEYQQGNTKNNLAISISSKNSAVSNFSTVTAPKVKNFCHQAEVYYIFQNIPIVNDVHRLVIEPGYLTLKGIGSKKTFVILEYSKTGAKKENSNVKIHISNPFILSISNDEITANQSGNTIVTIEKDGFSDSILVNVKE